MVLGAGIVGVSTALHLVQRGRNVLLIDRGPPGRGTSYGNAGVIEREGLVPITLPQDRRALLSFAMNRESATRWHWTALPRVLPWLLKLNRCSRPEALARYAAAANALQAHAADEHRAIAGPAGASDLIRESGWLRLYRSAAGFAAARAQFLKTLESFGLRYIELTPREALEVEPCLKPAFHRAVLCPETVSVASPGELVAAYFRYYAFSGGRTATATVQRVKPDGAGWTVICREGAFSADHVVVALGPWSMDLLRPLGYRYPMIVKRGYHRHYRPEGNATLERPVADMEGGYALTPMADGIRLTTGIEFARRDARPTPVQVNAAEATARTLFPLDGPVERTPWMGARPCLPDSLPILGRAPRHAHLWFNFGHGHLGLTEGPVTGRLLAEMVMGERPLVDVRPYAPERFSK